MDDSGTSLTAEPENEPKVQKNMYAMIPDGYEDKSLPPWIKEAKKKMK